jgi:SAM-dependent methyltransferase
MGIDLPAFEFLLKANAEFGDFGSTVVLGRQRLLMRTEADRTRFGAVLEKYRPDLSLVDVEGEYVDRLIKALGGTPYQVMDNSAYEGAEVIHDLNEPLPKTLKGQFDTVIDVGTLEHVFNIATAMKSMAEAVRVGGQFLCLNIANHHLGHGFWQFSPEVFFRTFCPAHGYEARLADLYYQAAFHPFRDPQTAGRRLPIKTPGYTYITFGARKTEERPIFEDGWPVQADYVAAWTLFLARSAESEDDMPKAESILREALHKASDNPAYMAALAALLRRTQRQHTEEYGQLLGQAQAMAPDLPSVQAEHSIVFSQTSKSLLERPDDQ